MLIFPEFVFKEIPLLSFLKLQSQIEIWLSSSTLHNEIATAVLTVFHSQSIPEMLILPTHLDTFTPNLAFCETVLPITTFDIFTVSHLSAVTPGTLIQVNVTSLQSLAIIEFLIVSSITGSFPVNPHTLRLSILSNSNPVRIVLTNRFSIIT